MSVAVYSFTTVFMKVCPSGLTSGQLPDPSGTQCFLRIVMFYVILRFFTT